jgi:hypothetical protein
LSLTQILGKRGRFEIGSIVKAISKECKLFLKGKKIPLRKEEELRGGRR